MKFKNLNIWILQVMFATGSVRGPDSVQNCSVHLDAVHCPRSGRHSSDHLVAVHGPDSAQECLAHAVAVRGADSAQPCQSVWTLMFSLKSLLEHVNVALVNSAISHPKFTFLSILSQVKSSTSRTSSHVILRTLFMLKCPRGLAYVGKTSRALKTRITEYRSAICNQDVTTPVAMHFKKAQHDIFTFRYIAIEVVKIPVQEATLSHCSWEENYTWFLH